SLTILVWGDENPCTVSHLTDCRSPHLIAFGKNEVEVHGLCQNVCRYHFGQWLRPLPISEWHYYDVGTLVSACVIVHIWRSCNRLNVEQQVARARVPTDPFNGNNNGSTARYGVPSLAKLKHPVRVAGVKDLQLVLLIQNRRNGILQGEAPAD